MATNTTTLSTPVLTVMPIGARPEFRLYPCDSKSVAASNKLRRLPGGGGGPFNPFNNMPGGMEFRQDPAMDDVVDNGDADSDALACPRDKRLVVVDFLRLQELDAAPNAFANHLSLNLHNQPFKVDTTVANTVTLTSSFDANFFRSSGGCTTVKTFTGLTNVTITGTVMQAGTVTAALGTLTSDSFKWSVHVVNWPYCTGTAALDLLVALKTRGAHRDDDDHSEDRPGPHRNGPFRPILPGDQAPAAVFFNGNTTKIVYPNFAILNGGTNVPINVTQTTTNHGASAVTHYKIPAFFLNATGTPVYANDIFYDPSYDVGTSSSALTTTTGSGAAPVLGAGGIALIVIGVLAVMVAGIFIVVRRGRIHRV